MTSAAQLPASQPSTALLVNWDKRTYVNLQTEKKKAKPDADIEVRKAPWHSWSAALLSATQHAAFVKRIHKHKLKCAACCQS